MKKLLTICILLCMYTMPLFSQESESDNLKEIRQKQIANIHSPELWDMDRMKNDIEPMKVYLLDTVLSRCRIIKV